MGRSVGFKCKCGAHPRYECWEGMAVMNCNGCGWNSKTGEKWDPQKHEKISRATETKSSNVGAFIFIIVCIALGLSLISILTKSPNKQNYQTTQQYAPAPVAQPPAPSPASEIRIINSAVAEDVSSNNEPIGINTAFPANERYGNTRRSALAYYVEYDGAVPNQTELKVKWFKKEHELQLYMDAKCSVTASQSSGSLWCRSGFYDLEIGNYEVRLLVNGNVMDRKSFEIVPRSN